MVFSFLLKNLVGNVTSVGQVVATASMGHQVLFFMSAGLDSSYFQQVRVGLPDKIEKGIKHGLLKISCIDGRKIFLVTPDK